MLKCNTTVLKRMVNPNLNDECIRDEDKSYNPCDRFEDGQKFVVHGWHKLLEWFCAYAWAYVHRHEPVLLSGGSYILITSEPY
jgi:uncharacterized repeat protein (TIGR04076 family)